MKKVNLDTSVINYIADRNLNGKDVSNNLRKIGLESAIGCHTLYELAKTFLYPDHIEKGKHLFTIINDLSPSIITLIPDLIRKEIDKLRTKALVLPFMRSLFGIAVNEAIEHLKRGFIHDCEVEFIKRRENDMRSELVIISQKFLKEASIMKQRNPNEFKKLKTFNNVLSLYKNRFPEFIIEILKHT